VSDDDVLALVLGKLDGVRQQGGYSMAKCPVPEHEDREASLSVKRGTKQPVLIKCHAGCDTADVLDAIGLTLADVSKPADPEPAGEWMPRGRRSTAVYSYTDGDGQLLFQVLRSADKKFSQRRPDPSARSGWKWNLDGIRRVPYRLPKVIETVNARRLVHVVEGERDVHAVEAVGGVATCNPGGTGAGWLNEYDGWFVGAEVVIVADKDAPGRKHAAKVASHLRKVAKSVKVVEAAEGKDAADHLAAGHGLGDFKPAQAGREQAPASPARPTPAGQPSIETGSGPATIRALRGAIDAGMIPDTYVSGGRVVHVERVSGTAGGLSGDEDSPLPVTASQVGPANLASLLAAHTYTYRIVRTVDKEGNVTEDEAEVTPPAPALAAALAPKEWPRLRPLFGIVGAPVLRPDGTLLQQPGYDPATGLYLASKVPLDLVPEEPTRAQVEEARKFLFATFLGDFPWVGPADKANYAGLLVTPILRSYLRTLIPFGVVTSTMPGSGKTILTCGLGMLYGQRVLTWTKSDEELRKSITSVLADPVGTIIFDNLGEGTVIDSPVLARLITDRTWADRLLSTNKTAAFANDRVWTATGNNLRLGGDMRTRSVLIGLNPNMPRPEERTGFQIPDLDQWILMPANQRQVLWHLLVLVTDWTRAGAPRQPGLTMRQFTPWAEAVGGFLTHHKIGDFLGNVETVRDIDDDDAAWAVFLGKWHEIQEQATEDKNRWVTSNQLRLSADIPPGHADPWDGLFLADERGKFPSAKSLGKTLTGQIDRYHGSFVLRSVTDKHTKARTWRVEEWSG
jgi:hypothetical protein